MRAIYYRNMRLATVAIDQVLQSKVLPVIVENCSGPDGVVDYEMLEAFVTKLKNVHDTLMRDVEMYDDIIESEEKEEED